MSNEKTAFFGGLILGILLNSLLWVFLITPSDKRLRQEAIDAGAAIMVPNHETKRFEFKWITEHCEDIKDEK